MNLTQQIERLLEEAAALHQDADPEANLPALLGEIDRVMDQIQRLTDGWEAAPESLSEAIGSLDAQFYAAGELYLQCCELIARAAEEPNPELLEEARATLSRAGKQLRVAEERAHEQFAKWTEQGRLRPPNRP
jgi:hypothetical protein